MGEREPANYMRLEVPARPQNVGLARVAVAAFAAALDFTVPEIEEIKAAVEEALSCAARGVRGRGRGTVLVTAALTRGRLEVSVGVAGRGVAGATRRAPMGIGLAVLRSLMDEVEVEPQAGAGTVVRMAKRPAGGGSPPEPSRAI